jgi:hypothetical protein
LIAGRLASRRPVRLPPMGSREVRTRLEPFARARTRQAMPGWAMRAVVVGVALDLAVLVTTFAALELGALPRSVSPSVVRFALDDRYWMIAPPLLLAALCLIVAGMRRAPLEKVARETDTLLGLHQRLGTALEIEAGAAGASPPERTGMLAVRQRADAVEALRRHEPTEAYPIRLRRRDVLATTAACLLLFAMVLVPELTGRTDRQLAEVAARAEADRLATLAEQIASDASLSPEDRAAMAAALAQTASDLEAYAADSQSALSALGSGESSLAQQASAGGDNSQLALSRVADSLDQAVPSRAVASRIDGGDYAGAAQELARIGDRAASLGQSDRAALSGALDKASRSTSRLDPQLSDKLAQAASSLDGNSQQSPQGAFAQAGDALQQAGQSAARQQALDRALAALQSARASVGSARAGANDLSRAEAGAADSASDGASAAGAPSDAMTSRASSQDGSGTGGSDGTGSPVGGQDGQAPGDPTGGSSAGKGSLARTGQNAAGDFRSRVVRVPTDQFGDPSVSAGQASSEGPVGEATVDYRQVLADYRQRATDAMAQRYIPSNLKDLVAAYFTSLDSGRAASTASQTGAAR